MRRSLANFDAKGTGTPPRPQPRLPLARRYRRGRTSVGFIVFVAAGLVVSWNLDQLMHIARGIVDAALRNHMGGFRPAWSSESTDDRNHTAAERTPSGHRTKDILAPCPPGFFVLGLGRYMLHTRSREKSHNAQATGFNCADGGCTSRCGGVACSSAAACGRQVGLDRSTRCMRIN